MRRGGRRKQAPRFVWEDLPDSARDGLWRHLRGYLEDGVVKGGSLGTAKTRRARLSYFIRWCEARGVERSADVTKAMLERYQRHLFYYRKKNGQPLSLRTQQQWLAITKSFFKWLVRTDRLSANPASELELPKANRKLPRQVLTPADAEAVLAVPDVDDVLGLRDRAILETFYSTGMRRAELAHLCVYDVDVGRGQVLIREGKGKKDRVIPIGERALLWIDRYTTRSRPELLIDRKERALFLSAHGEPLSVHWLSQMVTKHVKASGIDKRGSCHLFRHTMATLMLEGGADIRYVQAMLGHADLSTTEIYTHVSVTKLKEIHAATHPAASLRGARAGAGKSRSS